MNAQLIWLPADHTDSSTEREETQEAPLLAQELSAADGCRDRSQYTSVAQPTVSWL